MECIEGSRAGSAVYVAYDSHMYIIKSKTANVKYLQCIKKDICEARIVYNNIHPIPQAPKRPHTHDPDLDMLAIYRFKMALRREAGMDDGRSLQQIYLAVEHQHPVAVSLVPGYTSLKTLMSNARKINVPPTPSNVVDLNLHLTDPL